MSIILTPDWTLPSSQSNFIWYCAWLSLPSTIYASSHPVSAHLAIIPASVFATSLLYWRNPLRNSWRRKLDMIAVAFGVLYQTYHAFNTIHDNIQSILTYTSLIVCSTGCYGLSNYFMKCGHIWSSTYAHASVHIIANIANIVLYSSIKDTQIPKK